MNTSVQTKSFNFLDLVKWIVVVAIVAAGVFGNSYFANDYSMFERTAALIPMALVAIGVALTTVKGAAFYRLMKESRAEIRRVVWPTRQETTQTTFMVVVVVVIVALILWALDAGFGLIVSKIIG